MTEKPTSLHTFLLIWAGQLTSTLGSEMTNFAVTLWVWEITGKATALSGIIFFAQTTRVIAAAFAGIVVDRWSRKGLMLGGDTIAGLSTLVILLLWWTDTLALWHLYITAAVNSFFGYFQGLAYASSLSLIVPKQHYARAGAMTFYVSQFGSSIMAPALAGVIYYSVGLSGILVIDLVTFVFAVGTVLCSQIPQPEPSAAASSESLWQKLTFGFRYIFARSSLFAVLLFLLSSNLLSSANHAIFSPMILARTGNDGAVLARVLAAIGFGGLTGAIVLSVWGGTKRRIHGLLLGQALSDFSNLFLGIGKLPTIWVASGFARSFFSPFFGSSNVAIWMSKVDPQVQGRVFATRYLIAQISSPLGIAIAGPLADYVFEPAMMPTGTLAGVFGSIFGTGAGAGMALEYALISLCGVGIGLGGYLFRPLRDVEILVPDFENHSKKTV
jgi:DHA3 family macrolide efflux protein-like MFS transporter